MRGPSPPHDRTHGAEASLHTLRPDMGRKGSRVLPRGLVAVACLLTVGALLASSAPPGEAMPAHAAIPRSALVGPAASGGSDVPLSPDVAASSGCPNSNAYGHPVTLSLQQVVDCAIHAGFSGALVVTFVAMAYQESSFNPAAIEPGYHAEGILQEGTSGQSPPHGNPFPIGSYRATSCSTYRSGSNNWGPIYFNPTCAFQWALAYYHVNSYRFWGSYLSGAYCRWAPNGFHGTGWIGCSGAGQNQAHLAWSSVCPGNVCHASGGTGGGGGGSGGGSGGGGGACNLYGPRACHPLSTNPTPGSWYHIRSGDSLSAIAHRAYGNSNLYSLIAHVDHIANPNVITAGDYLCIPHTNGAACHSSGSGGGGGGHATPCNAYGAHRCTPLSSTPKAGDWYKVHRGDTLSSVSRMAYGTSGKASFIASKDGLASTVLTAGWYLCLPHLSGALCPGATVAHRGGGHGGSSPLFMPWVCQFCSWSGSRGAFANEYAGVTSDIPAISQEGYDLTSSGSFASRGYTGTSKDLTPWAKQHHVAMYPMITSCDLYALNHFLATRSLWSPFITQAVATARADGYAGYNVDFEPDAGCNGGSVASSDAAAYAQFMGQFATALHGHGLKLQGDFALWSPSFWSLSSMARTGVDVWVLMDYTCSVAQFTGQASSALRTIHAGHLGLGIDPEYCAGSPHELSDMQQEVKAVAKDHVRFLAYWALDDGPAAMPSGLWPTIHGFLHPGSGHSSSCGGRTYCASKAAAYANQYWDKAVSDGYFFWDSLCSTGPGYPAHMGKGRSLQGTCLMSHGVDCAHFVSSALAAGGVSFSRDPNRYGGSITGDVNAQDLVNYLLHDHFATLASASQLRPGDVVGYYEGTGTVQHVTLVVSTSGGPHVDAHTASQHDAYYTLGYPSSRSQGGGFILLHMRTTMPFVAPAPSVGAPSGPSATPALPWSATAATHIGSMVAGGQLAKGETLAPATAIPGPAAGPTPAPTAHAVRNPAQVHVLESPVLALGALLVLLLLRPRFRSDGARRTKKAGAPGSPRGRERPEVGDELPPRDLL